MATNPNRPQYLDTIASPWGQQVADHVIRRYPSTAARDADLAGIALADLAGQVVAILAGGRAPYLEMHDGVKWAAVPTGFDMQIGNSYVNSDANAHAVVNFPRPFAGVPVVTFSDASAGNGAVAAFVAAAMVELTADHFAIRPQSYDNSPLVGRGVLVGWHAIYVGAPTLFDANGDALDPAAIVGDPAALRERGESDA